MYRGLRAVPHADRDTIFLMSGHAEGGLFSQWWSWFIGLLFDVGKQTDYVDSWGISRALYLGSLYIGLFIILGHLIPNLALFTTQWLIGTAPVWLPIGLAAAAWTTWIWYIQSLYLSTRDPVLLEMKIPREILQTPRAMEIAVSSLWISSGETTFIHRAWRGQVRPFFSFEMASFGGDVHFYIWTWKFYEHAVTETIYSMYPEVELHEVEDYASRFQYDSSRHTALATEWMLDSARAKGRSPYGEGKFPIADVYPIKTYIDWELDRAKSAMEMPTLIDPLTNAIEFLSSAHPNEQIWVQFIIRKAGRYTVLTSSARDDEWKHAVLDEMSYIQAEARLPPGDSTVFKDLAEAHHAMKDSSRFPSSTPRMETMMKALERQMTKVPFEFLGRGIYIAEGHVNGAVFIHMRWMWKAMGNVASAAVLKPLRWHNDFDFPWQDIANWRLHNQARRVIDAFRRRSAFHSPWRMRTNVLTNESIATLWRPPSSVARSPGLTRIPAKKAEAPLNLPR